MVALNTVAEGRTLKIACCAKSATRNSAQTRERILNAARSRFSGDSYENVGIRDIAADAGVDAALVSRYFGGKEKLFAEVLVDGFRVEECLGQRLGDQLDDLGNHLATLILGSGDEACDAGVCEFDALRVLLRAAGNPVTAAIVSERFHVEFVTPLAGLLRGPDAELRAGFIAAYVVGIAVMRYALLSPAFLDGDPAQAIAHAAASIQACVDG